VRAEHARLRAGDVVDDQRDRTALGAHRGGRHPAATRLCQRGRREPLSRGADRARRDGPRADDHPAAVDRGGRFAYRRDRSHGGAVPIDIADAELARGPARAAAGPGRCPAEPGADRLRGRRRRGDRQRPALGRAHVPHRRRAAAQRAARVRADRRSDRAAGAGGQLAEPAGDRAAAHAWARALQPDPAHVPRAARHGRHLRRAQLEDALD